jgi:prepilin-type N-terminal cleavage/methylation domain-containing protein
MTDSIQRVASPVRRDARAPAGFTLIEVLLAIGLSVLLLGAISGAIDTYWRLSTAGRDGVERAQLARAIFDRIRREIRPLSLPERTTSTTPRPGVRGLWIQGPFCVRVGPGKAPGVQGDAHTLVLCRETAGPFREEEFVPTDPQASNLGPLEFRYFDGRGWLGSWDSSTSRALPRAIEVLVTFRGDSPEVYRTVVALPLSAASLGARELVCP